MTVSKTDEAGQGERAGRKFIIEVSDESFETRSLAFDDPIVTAAQIAEEFGAHPLAQFRVLELLKSGEIETKRPTETTDLREWGHERFFVIRGDRTYDFTVDGLALEWPLSPVTGAHLRKLARARDDQELVRVTPQGFLPISNADKISLDGPGVEEFRLQDRVKTVTVFYSEKPFVLEAREWSTEELINEFGVPAGHKLDLIEEGCEFVEMKPGGAIKLQEGMEFTSHVPVGQSS